MSKGSITFIGLGLYDENDISLKGLEVVKKCDKVFAEFYTAKLAGTDLGKLEKKFGKKIEVLSREESEKGDTVLNSAINENVVFLTCGDSMTATTHVDLRLRAFDMGIKPNVIHGSSIVTAVPGLLGLQNYKFGRTTTLAYPEKNYFPTSPYEVVRDNKKMGLHTLVLLDIQVDNNRFMTADEGINLLLEMEEKIGDNVFTKDSIVCVVARAGSSNPLIRADLVDVLKDGDFGKPLHSIVVPGNLHFMEVESLMKIAGLPSELGRKMQKL